jgi:SAM-dependent methyltransferase
VKVSEALARAQAITGWDWSMHRTRMAPFGWSYPDLLREHVEKASRAVDVGTGGGEVFSTAARPTDVALDINADRLAVARTRLPCALVRGDQTCLPFRRASFDLVTDRHVGVEPQEVLRVLRPEGIYLTQQPGGHICQDIFDGMGWGSNEAFWQRETAADGGRYRTFDERAADFREAGCRILRQEEAHVDYEFLDEESLAFWLANAPLPSIDIDTERDKLDALPLRTNWHSHLLILEAPPAEIG